MNLSFYVWKFWIVLVFERFEKIQPFSQNSKYYSIFYIIPLNIQVLCLHIAPRFGTINYCDTESPYRIAYYLHCSLIVFAMYQTYILLKTIPSIATVNNNTYYIFFFVWNKTLQTVDIYNKLHIFRSFNIQHKYHATFFLHGCS